MEEWKEYKLGEVLCQKGYIRGPFGSALKRGDLMNDGIPVYEQQHAIYNKREFRYFISKEKYNEMRRFAVSPKDIIISCSGTVGEVSLIKKEDPLGIISQALLLLRVDTKRILPEYLLYFFKTAKGHNSIISRSSGSVQVNIARREVIESIPLLLPSICVQKTIVTILKTLDDKIEVNRQINDNFAFSFLLLTCFVLWLLKLRNDNLEKQAQALFKSWFVDFEPFKDGEFVESEMGMIPKGWKVGNLFDIAEVLDKYRKPLSGQERDLMDKIYPYYGATSCMDYVDDFLFDGIYTLIGEDGSVVKENGLPYMQYVWGKLWVNNHAHILQGKNGFSTEMLHVMLSTTNIRHLVTGAVQAKLSQANMQKILVAIPSTNVLDRRFK